jgi:hypothetical protein
MAVLRCADRTALLLALARADQHASARGQDSVGRLESSTKKCARRRTRQAAAESCGGECKNTTSVVVFVASDDARIRDRILDSVRSLGEHVKAVYYSPPKGAYRHDQVAARGTVSGQFAAAVDLLLLGRADKLIRAGNRGFSSLSAVSAAVEAKPVVESLVVHPCEEQAWWTEKHDCVINLRTQPRMLMRWPLDNSAREKERVSCTLRDPAGGERTMAQRMHMTGSLDQWCEDLWEVGEGGRTQTLFALAPCACASSRRASYLQPLPACADGPTQPQDRGRCQEGGSGKDGAVGNAIDGLQEGWLSCCCRSHEAPKRTGHSVRKPRW